MALLSSDTDQEVPDTLTQTEKTHQGGRKMNRADLVEKIAAGTKLSKSNATRVLDMIVLCLRRKWTFAFLN